MFDVLTKVQDRLWTIWNKKLEVTEKELGEIALPRIIRLSRKLKLNEKESMALIFILCSSVCKANHTYLIDI